MELTKEESVLIIGFHRIVNTMDRESAFLCKKEGLTLAQFAVLEALYHKGELTVGQLKTLVLSTDGTMPVVLRNLEKEKLISKKQDADDRRKYLISLTEEGKKRIQKVYPQNVKVLREFLKKFSAEEKELLSKILLEYQGREKKQSRTGSM